MATVDLSDLIPDLEIAIVAPGQTDLYANVSNDEWLTRLRNAFWTAYNDGLIQGFTCSDDGIISSFSSSGDALGRDMQQIIIFYCGLNAVQNSLMQIKTKFRAQAGPVAYETEQSAQVLKGLLDALLSQRDDIMSRLGNMNNVPVTYIDAVRQRDYSMRNNYVDWVN